MLAIVRFDAPEDVEPFVAQARKALAAFAHCAGHRGGWVGRSTDEPDTWVLCTLWDNVGAYRRSLSTYDVKMHANPLMYLARDELTTFETLLESDGDCVRERATDRASNAADTAIGDYGTRSTLTPPRNREP